MKFLTNNIGAVLDDKRCYRDAIQLNNRVLVVVEEMNEVPRLSARRSSMELELSDDLTDDFDPNFRHLTIFLDDEVQSRQKSIIYNPSNSVIFETDVEPAMSSTSFFKQIQIRSIFAFSNLWKIDDEKYLFPYGLYIIETNKNLEILKVKMMPNLQIINCFTVSDQRDMIALSQFTYRSTVLAFESGNITQVMYKITLNAQYGRINQLEFSYDSRLLVAISESTESVVSVWNVDEAQSLIRFEVPYIKFGRIMNTNLLTYITFEDFSCRIWELVERENGFIFVDEPVNLRDVEAKDIFFVSRIFNSRVAIVSKSNEILLYESQDKCFKIDAVFSGQIVHCQIEDDNTVIAISTLGDFKIWKCDLETVVLINEGIVSCNQIISGSVFGANEFAIRERGRMSILRVREGANGKPVLQKINTLVEYHENEIVHLLFIWKYYSLMSIDCEGTIFLHLLNSRQSRRVQLVDDQLKMISCVDISDEITAIKGPCFVAGFTDGYVRLFLLIITKQNCRNTKCTCKNNTRLILKRSCEVSVRPTCPILSMQTAQNGSIILVNTSNEVHYLFWTGKKLLHAKSISFPTNILPIICIETHNKRHQCSIVDFQGCIYEIIADDNFVLTDSYDSIKKMHLLQMEPDPQFETGKLDASEGNLFSSYNILTFDRENNDDFSFLVANKNFVKLLNYSPERNKNKHIVFSEAKLPSPIIWAKRLGKNKYLTVLKSGFVRIDVFSAHNEHQMVYQQKVVNSSAEIRVRFKRDNLFITNSDKSIVWMKIMTKDSTVMQWPTTSRVDLKRWRISLDCAKREQAVFDNLLNAQDDAQQKNDLSFSIENALTPIESTLNQPTESCFETLKNVMIDFCDYKWFKDDVEQLIQTAPTAKSDEVAYCPLSSCYKNEIVKDAKHINNILKQCTKSQYKKELCYFIRLLKAEIKNKTREMDKREFKQEHYLATKGKVIQDTCPTCWSRDLPELLKLMNRIHNQAWQICREIISDCEQKKYENHTQINILPKDEPSSTGCISYFNEKSVVYLGDLLPFNQNANRLSNIVNSLENPPSMQISGKTGSTEFRRTGLFSPSMLIEVAGDAESISSRESQSKTSATIKAAERIRALLSEINENQPVTQSRVKIRTKFEMKLNELFDRRVSSDFVKSHTDNGLTGKQSYDPVELEKISAGDITITNDKEVLPSIHDFEHDCLMMNSDKYLRLLKLRALYHATRQLIRLELKLVENSQKFETTLKDVQNKIEKIQSEIQRKQQIAANLMAKIEAKTNILKDQKNLLNKADKTGAATENRANVEELHATKTSNEKKIHSDEKNKLEEQLNEVSAAIREYEKHLEQLESERYESTEQYTRSKDFLLQSLSSSGVCIFVPKGKGYNLDGSRIRSRKMQLDKTRKRNSDSIQLCTKIEASLKRLIKQNNNMEIELSLQKKAISDEEVRLDESILRFLGVKGQELNVDILKAAFDLSEIENARLRRQEAFSKLLKRYQTKINQAKSRLNTLQQRKYSALVKFNNLTMDIKRAKCLSVDHSDKKANFICSMSIIQNENATIAKENEYLRLMIQLFKAELNVLE